MPVMAKHSITVVSECGQDTQIRDATTLKNILYQKYELFNM